jgi:hypothetical protein
MREDMAKLIDTDILKSLEINFSYIGRHDVLHAGNSVESNK